MEKLQGPINPCLISEDLEVGNWLEEFISSTTANLQFEDPYNTEELEGACYSDPQHCTLPGLEDKMPFLQMLQTVEASHLHHLQQQQQHQQQQTTASSFPLMQLEPNFQFLLRLQHQKVTCFTNPDIISDNHHHHHHHHHNNINNGMIIMDLHSQGVKSECKNGHQIASEVTETQKCNSNSVRSKRNNTTSSSCSTQQNGAREKRKRKRATRPAKNKEEVETQRMTHIAVERNRRRQMNEHLNALRSLMPPSYAQRGDQASIIGGAIDFVKELEQMLQSLQAQKKMRQSDENGDVSGTTSSTTTSSSSNMFMDSSFPQLGNPIHSQEEGKGKGKGKGNGNNNINGSSLLSSSEVMNNNNNNNEEYSAEKKSALADIEVVVIQNHVNLKIQCQRRPGQLLKAIVAFEELRLTVLHLNITSLHAIVHYSFNLKIEDDCKLGSADEVARAVHQIFSLINLN